LFRLFTYSVRPPLLYRHQSVCPPSSAAQPRGRVLSWSTSVRHVFARCRWSTWVSSPAAIRRRPLRVRPLLWSDVARHVVFAAAGRHRDACCCRPSSLATRFPPPLIDSEATSAAVQRRVPRGRLLPPVDACLQVAMSLFDVVRRPSTGKMSQRLVSR